jgi:hypothetical protein
MTVRIMGRQKIWLFIAVICALLSTVLLLSFIVTDPGHTLIEIGGDAGHTYHSYLYHIIYEKGIWSRCINYPYGENMIYIDGLPFLSVPLSYLKMLHLKPEQALAIMHLGIGFSYLLAIIYVYKTLLYFKVRQMIAILFSCLIILTNPQAYRLLGHFALANTCVIPMLFYWSVLYYNTGNWRYACYIFLLGCVMSFFHLYFGGIIVIWILFYTVGFFILEKRSVQLKLRHCGLLVVVGAVMFAMVKSVIWLTDPIKDRPTFSSGADRLTHWRIILTSHISPYWSHLLESHEWLRDYSTGEGYVYIGVTVMLVGIIGIIRGIFLRHNKEGLIVSQDKFQPIWLFIALSALLLGMGVPFIWNMQWLLDYMSLFKQFRSMGRFSWIFYYIMAVYTVVLINNWYVKSLSAKKYVAAYCIVGLFLLTWGVDAKGYVRFFRPKWSDGPGKYAFYFSKNEQNWNDFLTEHHYKKDDFQAILILPFYDVGTEKLFLDNDLTSWVSTTGGKASLQLHLPIVDNMAARGSLSIAESQVRVIAGPFADKPLFKSGNRKPFLLLQSQDDSLDADSKYLLRDADYLGHSFGFFIYACYPDRVNANDKKYADTVNTIIPYMHGTDTCLPGGGIWFVQHFNSGQAKEKLFAGGATNAISARDSIIADIPVQPLADSQLYEFSAWFLLRDNDPNCPNMYIQLLDSAGNLLHTSEILTKWSSDNFGLWFRNSGYFYVPLNCRSIKCKLVNDPYPSYVAMDELLIRPANALVISRAADGTIMANNHLLRK